MLSCNNILPDNIAVYPVCITGKKRTAAKTALPENYFDFSLSEKEKQALMEDISLYLFNREPGTVFSYFSLSDDPSGEEENWQLCCCRYKAGENKGEGEVLVFHYQLNLLKEVKSKLYRALETERFLKKHLQKVSTLTRREKELVGLISDGMSNREISAHTYTSIHTVKTHRRNIIEKLGISSLSDLMRLADVFELNPVNSSE